MPLVEEVKQEYGFRGATGTGKTKTLQVMAEQLCEAGVPVFLADIKGDVSGMAVPGTGTPTPVAWTRLRAPQSAMEPAPADLQHRPPRLTWPAAP